MTLLDVIHVFIHVDDEGCRKRLLTIDMEDGDPEPIDVFERAADGIIPNSIDRVRHREAVMAIESAYHAQEKLPGQPAHADADLPSGGYVRVGRMLG